MTVWHPVQAEGFFGAQLRHRRPLLKGAVQVHVRSLGDKPLAADIVAQVRPHLPLHVRIGDGKRGHEVAAELVDDLGPELHGIQAHGDSPTTVIASTATAGKVIAGAR